MPKAGLPREPEPWWAAYPKWFQYLVNGIEVAIIGGIYALVLHLL